ncbi:hypothetical protein R3P38DRAFT_2800987 [Favolaschia claudopus]|uniref:Uncharacterized protein n=1 Tax=Favolaschia claudopus TaxID=2862362 RepID=A0AAV9ZWZ5_9AGAR
MLRPKGLACRGVVDKALGTSLRGPGRPKGSRKKISRAKSVDPDEPPKRRGRSPGTGHLQKERAASLAAGVAIEEPKLKAPIGRPRKQLALQPPSVALGRRVSQKKLGPIQ